MIIAIFFSPVTELKSTNKLFWKKLVLFVIANQRRGNAKYLEGGNRPTPEECSHS